MACGKPEVVKERNGYRLVQCVRDQQRWKHGVDLTLERLETDAMGAQRWVFVQHWFLSPRRSKDMPTEAHERALELLMDDFPVIDDTRQY